MAIKSRDRSRSASLRALAVLVVASAAVTACAKFDASGPEASLAADKPGSEAAVAPTLANAEPASGLGLQELAKRNAEAPGDAKTAVRYARMLKKSGRWKEAQKVLETAAASGAGSDRQVLAEQGLTALELGQPAKAKETLTKAAAAGAKDWRVLSGLGIAASSLGLQGDAQRHFQAALAVSPDNPTVLNNLAISYLLDNKLGEAEVALRKAAKGGTANPRVAQNLALVASLRSPAGDDKPVAPDATSMAPPMGLTGGLSRR